MMQEENQRQEINIQSSLENSFSLDSQGKIEFKGEVTDQNKEVIHALLNQAEYYKSKSVELEKQQRKRQSDYDSVIIIFMGCFLSLTMFGGYALTSTLIQNFRANQQPTGENHGSFRIG